MRRLEWRCLLSLLQLAAAIALTQHNRTASGQWPNGAPKQARTGRASVNTYHQTPEAGAKETAAYTTPSESSRTHQETQLTTLAPTSRHITPLMGPPAYQYSDAAPTTAKGESNNLPSKLAKLPELAKPETPAPEAASASRKARPTSQAHLARQQHRIVSRSTSQADPRATVVHGLVGQQVVIPCGAGLQQSPAQAQATGSSRTGHSGSRRPALAQQQQQPQPQHQAGSGGKRNISLLVWHKDGHMDAPVFVADARNVAQLRDAKQVLGAEWLRGRARLLGQEAALVLEPARGSDAGLYTCTLEFKEAPTEIHQILLELVDPPRNMQIRETVAGTHHERPVTGFVAGPFDEQSSATLSCQVESGSPAARLSWWRLESSWGPLGPSAVIEPPQSVAVDSLVTVSLEGQPQLHYLVAELPALDTARQGKAPITSPSLTLPFQLPSVHAGSNQRLFGSHWHRQPSQPASEDGGLLDHVPALQSAHLELNKLAREQLHHQFLCTASNNNFSSPLNSSVKLDLNLKPSEVRIMNKQVYTFRANQKAIVECRVFGSRPAPHITWLKGGQPLVQEAGELVPSAPAPQLEAAAPSDEESEPTTLTTATTTTTATATTSSASVRISEFSDMKEAGNNLAKISYLSFVPQAADHQRQLTCSAHNPRLGASSSLSDSLVMNVHYPAKLSLQLGAGLAAHSILLGMDVFMECSVDSNPAIEEINWLFNGRPLVANVSAGVLIFNATLVLQKLHISQRGAYQCTGENSLAKFHSNKLHLRPRFEPVCDYSLTKTKHEIPVNQSAKIECNVLAEPAEDLHFEWQFNQTYQPTGNSHQSSLDYASGQQQQYQLEDIKQFETNSTRSHAIFRPQTRRHQGQLLCWASNSVGRQTRPCVIQVVTSELPAPVFGCFFDDITSASFSVHCQSDKLPPSSSSSSSYSNRGQQNYLLELHSSDHNGPRGASREEATAAPDESPTSATSSTSTWDLQSARDTLALDNTRGDHNEAARTTTTTKVSQLTASSPSFFVSGLEPATNYNVIIYAIDAKGRLPPSFNQVTTLASDASDQQLADDTNSIILNPASEASSSGASASGSADKRQWQMLSLSERFLAYFGFSGAPSSDQPRMRPLVVVASVIVICSLALMMGVFLISRSCRLPAGASNLVGDAARQHLNSCKPELYDKRKPVVEKNVQLTLCEPARMRALAAAGGNGSDSSRETNTDSTTLSMTHHACAGAATELSLDRRMLSATTSRPAAKEASSNLSKLNCQDAASRLCESVHRRLGRSSPTSLAPRDASSTLLYNSTQLSPDAGGNSGLQLESASRCSSSYSSSLKQGRLAHHNINPRVVGMVGQQHLNQQQSAICARMAQVSPPASFLAAGYQSAQHGDRYLIQCPHTANLNEPIYVISNGGCCGPDSSSLELIDPSEHLWALQQQQHQHQHQLTSNELMNSYDTTPSSSRNQTAGELAPHPVRYLTSSASIPVSLSGGCQQYLSAEGVQHGELCLETTAEDGASSSFLTVSPVTEHRQRVLTSPDNHLMYYRVVDGHDEQQESSMMQER